MKKFGFIIIVIIIILGIVIYYNLPKMKIEGPVVLRDVFQLQQAQINSFDPVFAYHAGHIHIVKQIYNTLTDIDFNGKTIPSIASNWKSQKSHLEKRR